MVGKLLGVLFVLACGVAVASFMILVYGVPTP